MTIIDLSNYKTTLKQSATGRGFTPTGNVYFDKVAGKIEFIYRDELATVNFGVGPVPNPLIRADGIKFEAIYAFENQERAADESLRKYDRWTSGTFKFGGAYNFVKGRVPSTSADRAGIRGSGWNELDAAGVPTRTYFGNKGLSNIDPGSQPYYQLSVGGPAVNFAKIGQIDEAVQVYGDASNGGFTSTSYEAVSVRTYGNNYDRKETTTDLGIAELGGYSTGFALDESAHLTTKMASHPFASVLTTPTGVWVGMQLNRIASPVVKTEFSDQTGSRLFTWELLNPNGATLDQMVAWLDAFATSATKEADGLGVLTGKIGKNIKTWYTYNAAGKISTRSGVSSSEGLYLRNVPSADQQRVEMLDNSGAIKSYSFSVTVEAFIGSVAKSDAKSWYHSFFAAAYNTTGAVTVKASNAALVKGMSSTANVANKITFSFDYTGDTFGGSAATPKSCVFLVEGDGGAVQEKVFYTITETTTVAFSCAPTVENNV